MTLQKVSHQRTMIKYINVIVSPKQTKKGTPYPQALVCNSFQYHGVFALKFCAMQENDSFTHSAYSRIMQTYRAIHVLY